VAWAALAPGPALWAWTAVARPAAAPARAASTVTLAAVRDQRLEKEEDFMTGSLERLTMHRTVAVPDVGLLEMR
jgi:hypothetical protein